VLKKIQMSPRFFFCIMDSTVCLIACRTGKLAPLEKVQMNIQTFLVNIKLTLRNLPWGVSINAIWINSVSFIVYKSNTTQIIFQWVYPL